MFPCTPLVYFLGALCSFFIYILLFTNQNIFFLVTVGSEFYLYRLVNVSAINFHL